MRGEGREYERMVGGRGVGGGHEDRRRRRRRRRKRRRIEEG